MTRSTARLKGGAGRTAKLVLLFGVLFLVVAIGMAVWQPVTSPIAQKQFAGKLGGSGNSVRRGPENKLPQQKDDFCFIMGALSPNAEPSIPTSVEISASGCGTWSLEPDQYGLFVTGPLPREKALGIVVSAFGDAYRLGGSAILSRRELVLGCKDGRRLADMPDAALAGDLRTYRKRLLIVDGWGWPIPGATLGLSIEWGPVSSGKGFLLLPSALAKADAVTVLPSKESGEEFRSTTVALRARAPVQTVVMRPRNVYRLNVALSSCPDSRAFVSLQRESGYPGIWRKETCGSVVAFDSVPAGHYKVWATSGSFLSRPIRVDLAQKSGSVVISEWEKSDLTVRIAGASGAVPGVGLLLREVSERLAGIPRRILSEPQSDTFVSGGLPRFGKYYVACTDLHGSATFRGVLDGDYELVALERGYDISKCISVRRERFHRGSMSAGLALAMVSSSSIDVRLERRDTGGEEYWVELIGRGLRTRKALSVNGDCRFAGLFSGLYSVRLIGREGNALTWRSSWMGVALDFNEHRDVIFR